MADIFAVIADPTRRALLHLLQERRLVSPADPAASGGLPAAADISVGEIVAALGLTQPTVSKHLRVLRDFGLVRVREVGQHRYYSVEAEPLQQVGEWLAPFLAPRQAVVPIPAAAARTSPVSVPAPLRRAAENLPDAADVGASLGRAVAGAQSRILDPVKKRLGHREQGS
jgi:DNA-binding transcriptional ArsR family regulator